MKNDKFTMTTTGQAHRFAMACKRNGLNAEAVEFLLQGTNLIAALAAAGFGDYKSQLVNIKDFFQNSDTLSVDPDFTSWILGKLQSEVPQNPAKLVKAFDLPKDMSDSGIVSHAERLGFDPKQNPVTLDQIKAKIESQPNGVEGEMLNNGLANIFYVSVDGGLFTVRVFWCYVGRRAEWRVYAYRFDQSGEGDARVRIFCNES